MIVYLHGFNHSGLDLEKLLDGGLPQEIENGRELPALVISPQCPTGENWQSPEMVERLSALVAELVDVYGADPQRVSLTGFSMGGDGVWALGLAHPEQFAALAPVGSWYLNLENVCTLKETPVWVFQGEQDAVVLPHFAKQMDEALLACGGDVRLELFPGAGHGESSTLAYGSDALYDWLLEQRR
jgi:predicted peptidase